MLERDWKKEFASQLLNSNVEEDLTNATKLIKCHEKNLSVNGDFSCPGRKDIWQKVLKTNYCEDKKDLEAVAKSLVLDVHSNAEIFIRRMISFGFILYFKLQGLKFVSKYLEEGYIPIKKN